MKNIKCQSILNNFPKTLDQNSNVFALNIKVFEVFGLSIWHNSKKYAVFRAVTIAMCICYQLFKFWEICRQIYPFNLNGFVESVGKNLIIIVGVVKYLTVVSIYFSVLARNFQFYVV